MSSNLNSGFAEASKDIIAYANHRADVDGLRALAVLPVLLFHFHPSAMSGGFIGVDIFFVISGFVISKSILDDLANGKFTVVNFYFKRIRRIFPALTAVLLLTSLAAVLFLLPSDLVDYSQSLAATSAFVSNLYFWKSSGYFAIGAQLRPLLHTWSLAVEEQYYVVAPIAFLLIWSYGKRRWLSYLLPVLLLSFICSIAAIFVAPTANFFLLPTRAWELLCGAIVAFGGIKAPARTAFREAVALLGLVLIGFGLFVLDEKDAFPGWNALYPCIGTTLLIYAGGTGSVDRPPVVNRFLATSPLVAVGRISYSLYLVHWPLVSLARYATLREPTAAEVIFLFGASFILAWLLWKYIELPFRGINFRYRLRTLVGGVCAMLIVALIGGVGVVKQGLPARYPYFSERHIYGVQEWGGDACFQQNASKVTPWDALACTRAHGSAGRTLVWGDSFAAQYMPGVLRDAKRIDADVLQYTFAGCPPILAYFSLARLGCSQFNGNVLSIIEEQKIDTVVIAARWSETPSRALARLNETVDAIRSRGVRVFVFGQSPEFIADVQHIDFLSKQYAEPKASWTIAFDPRLNSSMRSRASDATFVDPLSFLCNGVRCVYRTDKEFLYADYGHFSAAGSLIAVQSYFPSGIRKLSSRD